MYRSNRDDQWSFQDKDQVKADFRTAVNRGYKAPAHTQLPPINPPDPSPPTPPTPAPEPDRDRAIDPTLAIRGVTFDFVKPPAGTNYWKIVNAVHLNEAEADAVGPDHHILGTVKRGGKEVAEIPFLVTWPSGDTHVDSKRDEINANYNYDYPMSASLNEYSIWVDDGNPTDRAMGIGMGADGNPRAHTSTWIDWEWAVSEGEGVLPIPPLPPIDPPILPPSQSTSLVHPLPGSTITQHFYQNPEDYARFGIPGHNGTDLGGKDAGTLILSVADGIVAFSDYDRDYGNYVRVAHRQDDMLCYVMYCHLAEPGALEGMRVQKGHSIGKVGSTGNSTGPHLHIEVRLMERDGTYKEGAPMSKGRVDPQTFFFERGLRL